MKALSIKQPWAWLIVNGHKTIENRDWATWFRGPLLIHTGKTIDYEGILWVRRHFPAIALPEFFDIGGIVGEATIVACVTESDSPWFVGRYGFVLRDARPLPFRAIRGQLGLFEVVT